MKGTSECHQYPGSPHTAPPWQSSETLEKKAARTLHPTQIDKTPSLHTGSWWRIIHYSSNTPCQKTGFLPHSRLRFLIELWWGQGAATADLNWGKYVWAFLTPWDQFLLTLLWTAWDTQLYKLISVWDAPEMLVWKCLWWLENLLYIHPSIHPSVLFPHPPLSNPELDKCSTTEVYPQLT